MPDSSRVFVVHGRNVEARRAMFSFLRSIALNPLEWTQAVNLAGGAPYIGEILDKAFDSAQAVIVLFTGDDLARIGRRYGREELSPQARANVLFEAGMALGRHPERTILVQLGPSRSLSDLAGRHLIHMDDSIEKRNDLAGRLKEAGCSVDILSRRDWHNEGSFDAALVDPDKEVEPAKSETGNPARPAATAVEPKTDPVLDHMLIALETGEFEWRKVSTLARKAGTTPPTAMQLLQSVPRLVELSTNPQRESIVRLRSRTRKQS